MRKKKYNIFKFEKNGLKNPLGNYEKLNFSILYPKVKTLIERKKNYVVHILNN